MSVAEKAQKKGRPRKTAENRKRNIQTVRVRDALRESLLTAADARQRSLSEEMEARLEQSFVLELEFGTGDRLALLRLVASTLRMAETLTGSGAFSSRDALQETRAALDALFGQMVNSLGRPIDAHLDALSGAGDLGRAAASEAVRLAKAGLTAPTVTPTLSGARISEHDAAIEAEIVRIAGEAVDSLSPESAIEWARSYPGGRDAALNEILRLANRVKGEKAPARADKSEQAAFAEGGDDGA